MICFYTGQGICRTSLRYLCIAALLGGTRFYGGEGSVLKTVVGALIIIAVAIDQWLRKVSA